MKNKRLLIFLLVALLFGGLLLAKALAANPTELGEESADGDARISEQRVDATAVFDEALVNGQPVYVLFHSLTCEPCVEISAVVDEVVPAYSDRITFVNAITDDPSAQELASRFRFQYIPTSFFISAEGEVIDSFTGVLAADEMRSRLDELAEAQ